MSPDVVLPVLAKLSVAGSLAVALVLSLRLPLRRGFGAQAAYALWWCVPLAMLAVLLPARRAAVEAPLLLAGLQGRVAPLHADGAGIDWTWPVLALWLAGALATAIVLGCRHLRFLRGLGALQAVAGGSAQVFRAQGDGAALPALVGLLRPRIVLPHDFERRYTAEEQRLVLAHERVHLRRGDAWANAVAAAVLCLHWFNPLLHLALRRFRLDQELACDAAVVAAMPAARKAYASAMLKTQFTGPLAPMACQWTPRHPLKERIAMLKRKTPSRVRAIFARTLVAALAVAGAYAAWAQQPARAVASAGAAAPTRSEARAQSATGPGVPASAVPTADTPRAGTGAPGLKQSLPPPKYPAEALRHARSGEVVLLMDIDAQGVPTGARVERSRPAGVFDQSVLDVAMQWRFEPARRNGVAVPGRMRVPVTFDPMMQPAAAPEGVAAAGRYRWYRIERGDSGSYRGTCDVLRDDPGDSSKRLCGVLATVAG
ncbi:TonB family protein [Stenotrophomonas sp. MMGLT7]|uniref:TonB family protein n=1 Tax=Stenotrophomonas sp. MMGLT7 TaxID=2901227 RepID=UPI001E4D6F91|nr:TonB family protein [Stenotrophomonas sp. MMGLT7]MCD7097595.1 TonB family protein [Stenotrophomonas sp. MMGLT7]